MNSTKYEELMLRFAKELHEVGVTEDMKKIVEAQYTRAPNVVTTASEEVTDRFQYSHCGYTIEAVRTVQLRIARKKA